jgi:cytochrome c oxidase assembly protein subunit 15
VGVLTIALTLSLWLQERRDWLRWLGLGALLLVILQGVIGGLRVVLLEHTLAIVHAAFAQAFFALTVSLAICTSPDWRSEPTDPPVADGGRLSRLCAATTGLIYLQAIFGAVLRHTGERIDAHLFFALLVTLHVIFVCLRIVKSHARRSKLSRPAYTLGTLLFLQLVLGAGSYFGKFTSMLGLPTTAVVVLTTAHLVIGALMLAASLLLTLRAYRLSPRSKVSAGQKILTEQFSG